MDPVRPLGIAIPPPLARSALVKRCTWTTLTDEGFAHLKGATKMTRMNLAGTKLTDAGLEVCKGFANLKHLNIGSSAITDAGLEHLSELNNLVSLDLRVSKVTAAGVQKLAKALPKCRIEWDGGTIEPAKK